MILELFLVVAGFRASGGCPGAAAAAAAVAAFVAAAAAAAGFSGVVTLSHVFHVGDGFIHQAVQ